MSNQMAQLPNQLKELLRPYWHRLNKLTKPIRRLLIKPLRRLPMSSEVIGSPKGFYVSTLDWIAKYELDETKIKESYRKIHPRHQICRSEPGKLGQNVHWKFPIEYQRESPETFVAIVPQGRVWGENSTIITPDDQVLADLSKDYTESINEHSIFLQWKLAPVHYINGTVAVLSAAAGHGYFHWMFDVLPRIELLHFSNLDLNFIDKFVVNMYLFPFQKETLSTLGIPHTKVIESRRYPHIKAEQLVVPSLPGISGNMPNWACNFLRNEFLAGKDAKNSDMPDRIYISRAHTNCRKIINETELMKSLSKLGFRSIFLESMSVAEQAMLFSAAKVVVAPHGAGLTNLVFCNPGTKVIEIFSPCYVNVCYWSLSNQVGIDYYYLLGEVQNPFDGINPRTANILVALDSFANLMKLAGVE
jgi:capsular polysaccharide biosynthesis protein